MYYISFLWIMAGLMVLYQMGMSEVIGTLQLEAMMTETKSEQDSQLTFVLTLFLTVLMWPLVLMDYQRS